MTFIPRPKCRQKVRPKAVVLIFIFNTRTSTIKQLIRSNPRICGRVPFGLARMPPYRCTAAFLLSFIFFSMKFCLVARSACCLVGIEQCRGFIVGPFFRAAFEKEFAGRVLLVSEERFSFPGVSFVIYQGAS
jgi:hypothetical protein